MYVSVQSAYFGLARAVAWPDWPDSSSIPINSAPKVVYIFTYESIEEPHKVCLKIVRLYFEIEYLMILQ